MRRRRDAMISIKIEGIEELATTLEHVAAKVLNTKRQFLAKEAGILKGRAMKNTPVNTGLLRGSWK